MKGLTNKIIIVTGGNGLLGKAFIQDLNSRGAIPINLDKFSSHYSNDHHFICDITKDDEVISTLDKIIKRFGQIDGLVNNAYPRTNDWGTKFEDISAESWRKNVDMQLNSYFVVTQAVLAQMKPKKSGSIVNIASIYGVVGNDFTIYENTNLSPPAAYSAIKGGLVNFTRYLASLYGKEGIRINCVSPGGIFQNQPEQFVQAYQNKVPLKRMGNPEDIAPSVSFLLSDESNYITGQNILVDGGWTAI